MAKIKVNEAVYDASVMIADKMLTINMESEITLEELAAQFDAAAAPEVRVLAKDGTTSQIYKNHAVLKLIVCPGEVRKVSVVIHAEALTQGEADRLQEQIDLQTRRIAAQAELLTAASVAARRTVAADYESMSGDELAKCTSLFDAWALGKAVGVGEILAHDGKLYRVIQAHTTQTGWEPDITPALFSCKGEPTTQEG